jgi:hypothetical protein
MRQTQTTSHNQVMITLLGTPEEVQREIDSIWRLYPPENGWQTWIKEDTVIKSTLDRFVIITRKEYI